MPDLNTHELTPDREALLQRFFEANPQYCEMCYGEPPGPGEAHEEIHGAFPAGWSFTKKWLIGYLDMAGEMVAMANVVSDLHAPRVWHIGYLLVAYKPLAGGTLEEYRALIPRDWPEG